MTDTSAEWSPFRFPDCSAERAERECVSRGLHFCSFFSTSFTLFRVCSPSPQLSLVLLSASLLETFALDYSPSLRTLLILLQDRLLYCCYCRCCCCCCTRYKFPLPICFSLQFFLVSVFLLFRSSVCCNKPV